MVIDIKLVTELRNLKQIGFPLRGGASIASETSTMSWYFAPVHCIMLLSLSANRHMLVK